MRKTKFTYPKNTKNLLNKRRYLSLVQVLFSLIFVAYLKEKGEGENKMKTFSLKTDQVFSVYLPDTPHRKKDNSVQRANYIYTSLRQPLLLLALALVCSVSLFGQAVDGWEKQYLPGADNVANDCVQGPDEGFLVVGNVEVAGGITDAFMIKTDPDGKIRWQKDYWVDDEIFSFGFNAVTRAIDGYVAVGYRTGSGSGSQDMFIVKINDSGDTLWTRDYGNGLVDEAHDIVATSDGGFAVVGYTEVSTGGLLDVFLLKLDANGDTLWTNTFGHPDYDDEGFAVIEASNGDLVATGYTELNDDVEQAMLMRTNADGELIFFNDIQGAERGMDLVEALPQDTDGGFIIAGNIINQDAIIIKTSEQGDYLWSKAFDTAGFADVFNAVTYASDAQGYVFAGQSEPTSQYVQGYQVKTNLEGDPEPGYGWEKFFGKELSFYFVDYQAIITTHDGGYFAAGQFTENAQNGDYSFYLTKTNRNGDYFSNYIEGRVFYDVDNSNDFNAGDQPIEGWIVEARSDEHTCYGTSLDDGSYTVLVDTGVYDVKVIRPNDYWTAISLSGLNFSNPCDTFALNFPAQISSLCTDMEVDVSTPALTPGGTADYILTVCNDGTEIAVDPYVDVTVDEALTIIGASQVFMPLGGGVFRFEQEMPDFMAPFVCEEITINTVLDASLIVGETHSISAHAYPDVFCNSTWDSSHLEVRAVCESDSVKLIIANTGPLAMSTATDYIIVEDMVLLTSPLPNGGLGAGQEHIIPKAANGATYRLLVDQEPGHPGDSRPSVAIEGCVAGGGSFSTGFVNQFDEDDYDHFLSVDCQENTLAILPNETRGYPKGYDSEHEISNCIDLKYIHRFQNTGPDTAIRVVIQDTLSPLLDPASVRPGVSSHDYTMEVYGCGILKFTFENIMLPSSSTDPEGSRVFVKYRISQKPGNADGALLENSAAIYFDYQAPVSTDTVYHTIRNSCNLEEWVTVSTEEIFLPGIDDIKVWPNPFQSETTVEIIGEAILRQPEMVVYDLNGRIVRRQPFAGKTFQFHRHNLTAGMYIYQIESDGQPVSSGKMIVE